MGVSIAPVSDSGAVILPTVEITADAPTSVNWTLYLIAGVVVAYLLLNQGEG